MNVHPMIAAHPMATNSLAFVNAASPATYNALGVVAGATGGSIKYGLFLTGIGAHNTAVAAQHVAPSLFPR
jgi:hypothetical protein